MQEDFNNLLFLTITVDAKHDFINCCSLDEKLLMKLFDAIGISPLETTICRREGCRKMAEKLLFYLSDRSFCNYTGICTNPENHWPRFCAPIGKVINEIESFTKVPDETIADDMKSYHPAIEALYKHQKEIIDRFNNNHNFRNINI